LPKPNELKHLYESYYNFGGRERKLYGRAREWFFRSGTHRLWAALDGDISFYTRVGSGRLLDVGCNEGRGLRIYSHNGYEVEGLELNEAAAAVAREAGFAVHTELLACFHPAALFDVAVLSNVLEHSLDPVRMLRDVGRILLPGGQVWISCPNSRSWLRSLFGRYWINWHAPFHIVHFSTETLVRLLRDAGFTGVELRQITPSLWVASSIITKLFASRGRPTRQLRNPFLLFGLMLIVRLIFFPVLYLCNRMGRGDCLVVTATSGGAARVIVDPLNER
jgi:SAM-dependent methyltransferase